MFNTGRDGRPGVVSTSSLPRLLSHRPASNLERRPSGARETQPERRAPRAGLRWALRQEAEVPLVRQHCMAEGVLANAPTTGRLITTRRLCLAAYYSWPTTSWPLLATRYWPPGRLLLTAQRLPSTSRLWLAVCYWPPATGHVLLAACYCCHYCPYTTGRLLLAAQYRPPTVTIGCLPTAVYCPPKSKSRLRLLLDCPPATGRPILAVHGKGNGM